MLGRLARELRLLGLDVEYRRGMGGMRVYRIARSHGRTLLTRNRRLKELEGVFFVNAQETPAQVAEVREKFGAEPAEPAGEQEPTRTERKPKPVSEPGEKRDDAFSRCLLCNEPLQRITRDQARPSVPFFIYQIHYDFKRCPKCQRVYWPGSHARDMEQRVRQHARPRPADAGPRPPDRQQPNRPRRGRRPRRRPRGPGGEPKQDKT